MANIFSDTIENPSEKLSPLRNSYLDLMQSCLTGSIYRDVSQAPFNNDTFESNLREHGLDWPAQAQTMIGTKRMANLRALTESVVADNILGDFIETGVWRGGACILMRAVLFAYNITDRCVWVADSFEGLPTANALQYPEDAGSDFHTYGQLAISLEQVQENFRDYGLLDAQVKFLKGWFKDTLPAVPAQQFALIRLDGDMYESTMDALTNLYPKLSHQGYAIIDDYHVVPACKAAVHDYCDSNGIKPEILEIDGVGVYWRKDDNRQRDIPVANLSPTVMSPELQVIRLNEALALLSRNVMAYLQNSLENRDKAVDKLSKMLTERDNEIIGLNQLLEVRVSQIESLHQSLGERDGQIETLYQSLGERDSQIAGLNQTMTERDGQIESLYRSLGERDSQIADLAQTISNRENQIEAQTNNIQQIINSRSWKLTKPLRVISRVLSKLAS
jgi:O-methyltransferase